MYEKCDGNDMSRSKSIIQHREALALVRTAIRPCHVLRV